MGKPSSVRDQILAIRRAIAVFSLREHWSVVAALTLGIGLSVVAFLLARQSEDRSINLLFEREAQTQVSAIESLTNLYWTKTRVLADFVQANRNVSPHEFEVFSQAILARRSQMVALEWAPRVLADQRTAFEQHIRESRGGRYNIWQLAANGHAAPLQPRAEYFPVSLVEPVSTYAKALGLDLGTRPGAEAALRQAGRSGELWISTPVELMGEVGEQKGLLAFMPVYDAPTPEIAEAGLTAEQRWARLQGFAVVICRMGPIIQQAIKPFARPYLPLSYHVYLQDETGTYHLIAAQADGSDAVAASLQPAEVERLDALPFVLAKPTQVGGQSMLTVAQPLPGAVAAVHTWHPLWTFIAGLIITWMVAVYLWLLLSRTAQVESLVARRTNQLARVNQDLRQENTRRLEVENELSRALAKERDAHEIASKARQELAISEARYRIMGETVPYGVWLLDPQGEPQYFSQSFLDLLQMSLEETQHQGWTRRLPPEEVDEALHTLRNALQTGRMLDTENRFLGNDGRYHTILVRGLPLRDDDGKIVSWVGINLDITQRKQAEEELRQHRDYLEEVVRSRTLEIMLANEELRRDIEQRSRIEQALRNLQESLEEQVKQRTAELAATNRELEAFSYSVSHDLRAPLRHIAGFVQMLQKQAMERLDETGRRHLQIIAQSANRMGNLIDDLLKFSRLGRAAMQMHDVDLNALVEDVRSELQNMSEPDRQIDWHIDDLPTVRGDPALLRIVLVNLLSNALKYSRNQSRTRIEIGSLQSGQDEEQATVYVRDNGVGFDMQYANRLFGVFQRLHTNEEFEGTGIGLAVVQRIVHRHGGGIRAEAQINGGATFYFSLSKAVETHAVLEANSAGGR